jgi:hypothetical protein
MINVSRLTSGRATTNTPELGEPKRTGGIFVVLRTSPLCTSMLVESSMLEIVHARSRPTVAICEYDGTLTRRGITCSMFHSITRLSSTPRIYGDVGVATSMVSGPDGKGARYWCSPSIRRSAVGVAPTTNSPFATYRPSRDDWRSASSSECWPTVMPAIPLV